VLGGLVVHQQRRQIPTLCNKRFKSLKRCAAEAAAFSAREASHKAGGGYGRDPTFNPSSALFLPLNESDYFNASTSAQNQEVDAYGYPFGFFPRSSHLPLGYFAVFQVGCK